MAVMRTSIHQGTNDDRWFLCVGDDPTDVFVFHEPNGPSGGKPYRIELSAFLASGDGSPERLALLRMVGSLVELVHPAPPPSPRGPEAGAAGAEPSPGEEASTT